MSNKNDKPPVLFSPPSIGEVERERVTRVLESGWLTTGPETKEFEKRFSEYVGSESSLAVNSCTSALCLALHAAGVTSGAEVITTTNTFASTVNVIEHLGAKPVLVDTEPDTMNLDPVEVERKITDKTEAVIAVHFAGHPVELGKLQAICDRHKLVLIEDAAHAVPASYEGTMIGGTGNLTAFSFYATKNLTTGEGGMLTGPQELIERARSLSLHGMSRGAWNRYGAKGNWHYDILAPGFKCNMGDLQAAIGIAQLDRLSELQQRRNEIFDAYNSVFTKNTDLITPVTRSNVQHAWHLYVLRLTGKLLGKRDQLFSHLQEQGISPSLHFIPIHNHQFYREKYGFSPNDFPVAQKNYENMLSLPLSPALTADEVERVIDAVNSFVSAAATRGQAA